MGFWAICAIAAASIALMLWRPRGIQEAWWVGAGVALLLALRLLPLRTAAHAIGEGTDVYLFLTGMMLLSELANEHGVFDWLAAHAIRGAAGSPFRLFLLIYAAGIAVTALMSNDATAVVMTPAVLAAIKRGGGKSLAPEPYLFACAMIANAASFLLPISNPANLVVYQAGGMPSLARWFAMFLLPSIASIATTLLVLSVYFRRELHGGKLPASTPHALSPTGRLTLAGIACMSAVLIAASALRWQLGLPACLAALAMSLLVSWRAGLGERRTAARLREVFAGVSWSVLPLVAALFCLVAAVNRIGLEAHVAALLQTATTWPRTTHVFGLGLGTGIASNLVNNLPLGLVMGGAVHTAGIHGIASDAVLLGVDLGPNLSITGSLATILWLIRIRREGVSVGAGRFLLVGSLAMPLALAASLATLFLRR